MIQHQWMLVANQFTNKRVIHFLVLECCYVIRLVGIKQIPSFLLSLNRPKRVFFLPWEGWGVWILLGWGEEFESELSSLSSKIDFFFFNMKVFQGVKFSKVQMLKGLSVGVGGILELQIDWSITEDFKKKAQLV